MPTTPMPIDLVEPDAPAPAGDRLPCHLFADEVDWPTAAEAVLRKDRAPAGSLLDALGPWMEADLDPPPPSCPPCTGRCRQGRACPAFAPLRSAPPPMPSIWLGNPPRRPAHRPMLAITAWLAFLMLILSAARYLGQI